jgi:hypothetical protein
MTWLAQKPDMKKPLEFESEAAAEEYAEDNAGHSVWVIWFVEGDA